MSKVGVALAMLLAAMSPVWACEAPEPPKPRGKPYGQGMQSLMASLDQRRGEAVFIGDSIVAGWPLREREAVFRGPTVNFGAGGDTTSNVLWRLEQVQNSLIHFNNFVVLVGTNDLSIHSACQIAGNIGKIVDNIKKYSNKPRIYIINILPRGKFRKTFSKKIEEINNAISIISSRDKNLFSVNVTSDFINYCGSEIDCDLYKDYLHLTEKGYSILSQKLKSIHINQNKDSQIGQ